MPEYLSPGVYLEEVDGEVHPIEGVSTTTEDAALKPIADAFRQTLRAHAPGWTDVNEADPGITILEIFAFLAEGLLYRTDGNPDRGRAAARAAAALAALDRTAVERCGGLVRPLYYSGRVLDAATLSQEQEYHREKRRLHNREVVGSGVVSGLTVRVEPTGAGGSRVVVEPGFAIDSRGEEILLPCEAVLILPASGASAYVTIRFWERVCAETPEGPSAVEEACVIGLQAAAVAPTLGLARLLHSSGSWRVDPSFSPPRASRKHE